MTEFSFFAPNKISFGDGVAEQVGDEIRNLGGTCVLIVADPGVAATSFFTNIKKCIIDTGIKAEVFTGVVPNPVDEDCLKGYEFAKSVNADLIVTIGGGSSMDTAKTIATLMTHGGKPEDYYGDSKLTKAIAPLIALPTTSGTASEVTPFAVITDTKTRIKMNILDPKVVPKVALVDPLLTVSLPKHLTASTGLDALTHAIEAYTCTLANPLTDTLALKAITLIVKNIRQAYEKGDDAEARAGMSLGSLIAGLAFGNADVGGVHCMAEAIGGFYDTPHGVANSIFLPLLMEFNIPADPQKHADIAAAMGLDIKGLDTEEAAMKGVEAVQELCIELGIPKFKELDGVKREDFAALSKGAANNVSVDSNPRKAGEKEYLELFEKAYSL